MCYHGTGAEILNYYPLSPHISLNPCNKFIKYMSDRWAIQCSLIKWGDLLNILTNTKFAIIDISVSMNPNLLKYPPNIIPEKM